VQGGISLSPTLACCLPCCHHIAAVPFALINVIAVIIVCLIAALIICLVRLLGLINHISDSIPSLTPYPGTSSDDEKIAVIAIYLFWYTTSGKHDIT